MMVRVRIIDDEAFFTLKRTPTGIVRDEYEFPIDLHVARDLIELHCGGRVVSKNCYCVPNGAAGVRIL
ncbi:inorganic triphosphatase [mine drainage metagenome]|uniref:Inorganic triphosphatase n=1 Tax=mine drainage metagenome TaxID=410659 RepID=A0A1J5S4A1_9ZZZZ